MQIEIEYRLRRIRKEKGVTLKDLSVRSGVSYSELVYIEKSERNPRVKTLCAIAAALDAKLDELVSIQYIGRNV